VCSRAPEGDREDVGGSRQRARFGHDLPNPKAAVDVTAEYRRNMVEQSGIEHGCSAASDLFGRLEYDEDVAERRRLPQQMSGTRCPRRMNVMTTGVHHPRGQRGVFEAGILVDWQRIHVATDRYCWSARLLPRHAYYQSGTRRPDHVGGLERLHLALQASDGLLLAKCQFGVCMQVATKSAYALLDPGRKTGKELRKNGHVFSHDRQVHSDKIRNPGSQYSRSGIEGRVDRFHESDIFLSGMKTSNITTVLIVMSACATGQKLAPNDADVVLSRQLLHEPNPATEGRFTVRRLYYGSGTDRRRPEFRDSVSITTETVDATKLVNLGNQADSRNGYWGFTPKEFPINGRVWYPDGDGPFPLVLAVHGNHNMRDFSDPGYGYLGELLASRGYIFVSVDMNFVNGGIRGENDARGWLLLKHLEAWRKFGQDAENLFFRKADLDHVALIGHSRGGEAVGHAAAFNTLRYYPDDASLEFDFGFGIQSIIAIAPVDGQYLPTGRKVPVENVNYLVFHGSHDGDVTSFHGLRQYHRVRFTDGSPRFKAAVYVYRANHGQWNSVWGSHDNGPRSGRILDLSVLLDPGDQREFGKVYISAFLDATLMGKKEYLPLFRDHRVAGEWLPKTMYITRLETSGFVPLATFEEDIDITTGQPGVRLSGDSLSTWRENMLDLRSANRSNTSASQENQAVTLGWNNRVAGRDSADASPARYTIDVSRVETLPQPISGETTLDILLAPTRERPDPRRAERDTSAADSLAPRPRRNDDEEEEELPMDLSVEIRDRAGHTASLPLSRYGAIRRPLETRILRRGDLERDRFENLYEVVLQSYSIALGDFVEANPAVAVDQLTSISLVFDRTDAGTVVVDDIGLSWFDPAFRHVSGAR